MLSVLGTGSRPPPHDTHVPTRGVLAPQKKGEELSAHHVFVLEGDTSAQQRLQELDDDLGWEDGFRAPQPRLRKRAYYRTKPPQAPGFCETNNAKRVWCTFCCCLSLFAVLGAVYFLLFPARVAFAASDMRQLTFRYAAAGSSDHVFELDVEASCCCRCCCCLLPLLSSPPPPPPPTHDHKSCVSTLAASQT